MFVASLLLFYSFTSLSSVVQDWSLSKLIAIILIDFLYYVFTLWTDQRYTSTQSHWLTCISAVSALEPFSWPWARRHNWRHRSLSPSRGWLETANEQTTSTRIILRFVIIGHSYQSVSQAYWQSQVYQFCLFSIIQDPLTDEPDRSRSFGKDAQIWLFSIQWCGLFVSHDLYLSLGR